MKEHVLKQLPPKRRQIIILLLKRSDIISAKAASGGGVNHDASERNAAEAINSENLDGSDGNLSYLISINQNLHVLLP